MRNWDSRDELGSLENACSWKKDWDDVQKVCKMLDLPCAMVRGVPITMDHRADRVRAGRPVAAILEPSVSTFFG